MLTAMLAIGEYAYERRQVEMAGLTGVEDLGHAAIVAEGSSQMPESTSVSRSCARRQTTSLIVSRRKISKNSGVVDLRHLVIVNALVHRSVDRRVGASATVCPKNGNCSTRALFRSAASTAFGCLWAVSMAHDCISKNHLPA
ncbi:hypothetical protein FXB41_32410 [Bradyrhizobium canariense]|uniref:hypothetical protein n=1 Tax=Bradyrhizobium canariense TaxID=255045 RepID=UPI001CA5B6B1|nr:hypothetical protein [Bradyrhizobium canariense]MBW5439301.1 hypothetical protein [Bradyrhizobium canariense]